MDLNKNYPFAVWFCSIFLGTIPISIETFIIMEPKPTFLHNLRLAWFVLFNGFVSSWPTFIVFYIAFKKLVLYNFPAINVKFILLSIAIAGVLITSYFFGIDPFDLDLGFFIAISYIVPIIFFSLLFKIFTPASRVYKTT